MIVSILVTEMYLIVAIIFILLLLWMVSSRVLKENMDTNLEEPKAGNWSPWFYRGALSAKDQARFYNAGGLDSNYYTDGYNNSMRMLANAENALVETVIM